MTTMKKGKAKGDRKTICFIGIALFFCGIVSFQTTTSSSSLSLSSSSLFNNNDVVRALQEKEEFHDVTATAPEKERKKKRKNKKFLLGIFSMISPSERSRRQLIRETYLERNTNILKNNPNVDNSSSKICDIRHYMALYKSGNLEKADECVVLYAFIVGGGVSTSSNYEEEDHFRTNRPLEIFPESPGGYEPEPDVIYLNVKENLVTGKVPTYFKWAFQMSQEYDIDYVSKVDDDTMLFMPYLFEKIIDPLPPFPYNQRLYGGWLTDFYQCGGKEHCLKISPDGYMAGQFYFMSPDLAYVVSSDEHERNYALQKESLDIGVSIFDWAKVNKIMIHLFVIGGNYYLWEHPVIDSDVWKDKYNLWKEKGISYVTDTCNLNSHPDERYCPHLFKQ